MKKAQIPVLLLISLIAPTSCSNAYSTVQDGASFYSSTHYSVVDPNSQATNAIIIIYSPSCSHCEAAEPHLQNISHENYFQSFTFISVRSVELFSKYNIGMDYNGFVDFYTSQVDAYKSSGLDKDYLSGLDYVPTPTVIYLNESREVVHAIMGLGSSIKTVRDKLNLLTEKAAEVE